MDTNRLILIVSVITVMVGVLSHLDILIILQARHPERRTRRQRLRRRIRLRQHRQRLRNCQRRGCRWMMMAAGLAGFRQQLAQEGRRSVRGEELTPKNATSPRGDPF